jgi:3-deoxy-D-manno-octulosonic-acid transferase
MFLIYKFLTIFLYPILILTLYIRTIMLKEDPKRFKEKILLSEDQGLTLKKKFVIWFHGASIGEISTIIPIIKYLIKSNETLFIIITSVTVSSGKIITEEFKNNNNVIHRYFPLDVPHLTKKFLNKWNPSLIAFVDSEIWPNFIHEIKKRKKPLLLVNARITKKTLKRWLLVKNFSKKIFSSFDISIASSEESLQNLKELGSKEIKYFGNLKFFSKTLNNKLSLDARRVLDNFKVWCAASTHEGEDLFFIKTHKELKKIYQNTLTVIIPRHINRVNSIFSECLRHNMKAQIINNENEISKVSEIIIVNSFGVLSKYYDYCRSVFMGKSLLNKFINTGGQNPIEAAKLGCKVYSGPYVYNFNEVYKYLEKNRMAKRIKTEEELVKNLLVDFNTLEGRNENDINKLDKYGDDIFKKTIREIENFII